MLCVFFLHIVLACINRLCHNSVDFNYKNFITDSQAFTTGSSSGITAGVTYPGDMLYLMPEHTFTSNGTIVGLEFTSTVVGLIHVQVGIL